MVKLWFRFFSRLFLIVPKPRETVKKSTSQTHRISEDEKEEKLGIESSKLVFIS